MPRMKSRRLSGASQAIPTFPPTDPGFHKYVPHPKPPQRSIQRGRIRCFYCGAYDEEGAHITLVQPDGVREEKSLR